MLPFWKKKSNPDTAATHLEIQVRDLNAHIRRLEEALDRLSAKSPQITIENIHIHQPVLEKMEYRLDGLDIEHLSGSLNLGNNFGAKINPEPASTQLHASSKKDQADPSAGQTKTKAAADRQPSGHSGMGLHHTSTGFRLKK